MFFSIILQGILIIWLLSSIRVRKEMYHFVDRNSMMALKGYFSIIIVLFHVPVSNIICNFLGCSLFVIIVTLYSFFSTYGMTIKMNENKGYVHTVPRRFARIAILYGVVLFFKYYVTGMPFSGGILWMNNLLLSYVVFYFWLLYRSASPRD